jgi:hypothetical protein
MMTMTEESRATAWALRYAMDSGVSLSWLMQHRVVVECDCAYEGCDGFGMSSREIVEATPEPMRPRIIEVFP